MEMAGEGKEGAAECVGEGEIGLAHSHWQQTRTEASCVVDMSTRPLASSRLPQMAGWLAGSLAGWLHERSDARGRRSLGAWASPTQYTIQWTSKE